MTGKKGLWAVLLSTALLILPGGSKSLIVQASGDGSAYTEISATLERSTVSGNQPTPKPKPPGGGGGGEHHHHDEEDDTPSPTSKEEKSEEEKPVVPVVYLPGPGVTKLKAVPVPGETIVQQVTKTVTGNEAILPKPGAPVRISVSGNGVPEQEKRSIPAGTLPKEEGSGDVLQILLILVLLLLLLLILTAWFMAVRRQRRKRSADPEEQSRR